MQLPSSRGPLSAAVFAQLRGAPRPLPHVGRLPLPRSDDFQITLWVLQELGFRPIEGVAAAWECERSIVELRRELEAAQEAELRDECFAPDLDDVGRFIEGLASSDEGPSLSHWMEQHGALDNMREFVAHRAPYQLKEADPHSFAIPRLAAGRAKSALLKIQMDEYGNTEAGESHQELYAETMDALDTALDLDEIPAVTLRTNTVLNAFAAQRRLLGALIGHLAVFEVTSVEPMARYAATLRRLLPGEEGTRAARFYDVHVAADGFHGRIAIEDMVDGFVAQYPDEAADLVFGALAVSLVEAEFARHLIACWEAGGSSLQPRDAAQAA